MQRLSIANRTGVVNPEKCNLEQEKMRRCSVLTGLVMLEGSRMATLTTVGRIMSMVTTTLVNVMQTIH